VPGVPEVCLRADDGTVVPLDLERWHHLPDDDELALLDRVLAPVLDLGCGPGRHVVALGERGIPALGIDAAPAAVATARARGALVLERSIFARIPGTGRWGTVLLLDGNIGIGGDPVALLRRSRALLRADGHVLAELAPPGAPSRSLEVRLERDGALGPRFPWAVLGADDVAATARAAGLRVADIWQGGDRWFSQLAPA
jgi:SAM-dependent methyltransferase